MGDSFFRSIGFKIYDRATHGPWTFTHPSYAGQSLSSADLHEFVCVNCTQSLIDFICKEIFGTLNEVNWFLEQRNLALGYGFVFDRFVIRRFCGVQFTRGEQTMTIWQNNATCEFNHTFYKSVPAFLSALV